MKKRITVLACLTFALVWVTTHSHRTSAYYSWPEEYGACMTSNLSDWGGCFDTRGAAEDACEANYPVPPFSPSTVAACKAQAHANWWDCESDSNNIFGNCVGGVNLDYNEPDFCANALSVYNECFNTYQCEAIEDDDERFFCTQARWTCASDSGIDSCR